MFSRANASWYLSSNATMVIEVPTAHSASVTTRGSRTSISEMVSIQPDIGRTPTVSRSASASQRAHSGSTASVTCGT